jgi:glycosyltransferase involved in cell wall biosynthesis
MTYELSVVVPCFNEENTIEIITQLIMSQDINLEIIIINDCSTDNTQQLINELVLKYKPRLSFYKQEVNMGKGAAIKKGFGMATGKYILIQDADLEYHPNEYKELLKPLQNGYADVVYGSRFIGGKPHRVMFFWHRLGNWVLTSLSNILTNLDLTDMETGYKVFKAEIAKKIVIQEHRFGFEPEITAKLSKMNINIYEIGISYYGRTYAEGKKIGWKDGFRAIYCIFKYNILK